MNRYAKRGWLLAVYRKLNRLATRSVKIDRRERPSRDEFFDGYYTVNRPVLITGMMDDWQTRKERLMEVLALRLAELPRNSDVLINENPWQERLLDSFDDLPPIHGYFGEPRFSDWRSPAQHCRHVQPVSAEPGERLDGPGDGSSARIHRTVVGWTTDGRF